MYPALQITVSMNLCVFWPRAPVKQHNRGDRAKPGIVPMGRGICHGLRRIPRCRHSHRGLSPHALREWLVLTGVMGRTERELTAGRVGANADAEVEPPAGGLDRSRLVAEFTEVDGPALRLLR